MSSVTQTTVAATDNSQATTSSTSQSQNKNSGGLGSNSTSASARSHGFKILVNPRQKGNPLLQHIRAVPFEFEKIIPDFLLGESCAALFLSLKFHRMKSSYIHDRFRELGHRFRTQILLVKVDVQDSKSDMREINKMCVMAECSLVLAWSDEEAARYIELFKSCEHKPADIIMGPRDEDPCARMINLLTSVRTINKTDATQLLIMFGTLKAITEANVDELALCQGMGPVKADKLYKAFREPFYRRV